MCGLFGEFGPDTLTQPDALSGISRTLHHRGPDDDGIAAGTGWMLGFRRLSILDLSQAGHQPMMSPDGRYVLAFNGEIYNYRELRSALEETGESFNSGTDTEVLLRLLTLKGPTATLALVNGMYAFALVDLAERRFVLARDRLGVKPLVFYATRRGLRFASELKALLAWPDAPRELDRQALADYLATGYVAGAGSILKGYFKLLPGHFAVGSLDAPKIEPQRYWHVDIRPGRDGSVKMEAAADALDALLSDAVTLRLRADVPMALLLSGGIDSGLVAAHAAATGAPPLALVAGSKMTQDGVRDPSDETDLARATAQHLGLTLEELDLGPDDLTDLDAISRVYDEPFADPSALAMMRICALARGSATVLLSGDGGDEAFGGYRRYLETARHGWLTAVPPALRRMAWAMGRSVLPPRQAFQLAKATLPGDLLGSVFDGMGLMRDPVVRAVLPADVAGTGADVTAAVAQGWGQDAAPDMLSRQRAFDYRQYLPDDVLTKTDRASMFASTELRSPFLDYRIVEFAARLPNDLLRDERQGKLVLRHLASKRLPAVLTRAPKRGFTVPVGAWLRLPAGAAMLRERLLEQSDGTLWRTEGVRQVIDIHVSGRRDCGDILWRLLILESWARHYLKPGQLRAEVAA